MFLILTKQKIKTTLPRTNLPASFVNSAKEPLPDEAFRLRAKNMPELPGAE